MIDALALGTRIVELARGFNGACACPKHKQTMFEAVGFPFDIEPFHIDANGKVHGISTCYVFARHILELAGIALPPWHMGEPIGAIIAWAKRTGCWQTPEDGCVPSAGDVLVIGSDGGKHVCIVSDCDESTVKTIDGGQVCRRTEDGHDGQGRQMVAERSREWHGDRVVGIQRDEVVGWVDIARAPLANNLS